MVHGGVSFEIFDWDQIWRFSVFSIPLNWHPARLYSNKALPTLHQNLIHKAPRPQSRQVRGNSVKILACIKNAILAFDYEEFKKFQGF